jgi:hypothetical protein
MGAVGPQSHLDRTLASSLSTNPRIPPRALRRLVRPPPPLPFPSPSPFSSFFDLKMILTERPLQLPHAAAFAHRRAPSAPVVVGPTKVPGLLSISKPAPARSPAKPQQPRQRSPKGKNDKPVKQQQQSHADQAADHPSTDKPARGRQNATKASKQPR